MEYIFRNVDRILLYACVIVQIISIILYLISFIGSSENNVEKTAKSSFLISNIGFLVLWLLNRNTLLIKKYLTLSIVVWLTISVLSLLVEIFMLIFRKNFSSYPIRVSIKKIMMIGIMLLLITC